jgi:hypothetical protein
MKKFAFSILVACVVHACTSFKPSSNGGNASFVKIFVKGPDSLLCFAGPHKYRLVQGHDEITMDYTYLKVRGARNRVVCNFSLVSKKSSFLGDTVYVNTDDGTTIIAKLNLFFAEGYGRKKYLYRYSFETTDLSFRSWMLSKKPIIQISGKTFSAGRKWGKHADLIYRNILFDAF